ncbi:MAG: penicillin acylase family protein [Candidatus Limnocylindria bacterium]
MPRPSWPRHVLRLTGRRLPRTSGRLRVTGISAPITIIRDSWGIPHVEATTEADAWFGLGFCHGQDRAFQLELLLRAGRGSVSALVGAAGLPIDRLSRRLGFAHLARRQRDTIDDDVRQTLGAYVRGVNAALGIGPRPHELLLLRAGRLTPWTVEDVLAFLGLQAMALAGNWDIELARLRILVGDGPDALISVDPLSGPEVAVGSPLGKGAGPSLELLAEDLTLLRDLVAGAGGSNAWAIAGSRTASGMPLLANDPHLAPSLPAPWYLAHLRTPSWEIAGASFVGGPAFPTAHNGHVAWGITAANTDGSDLFIEQVGSDGRSVRHGEGWEPCEVRREEIDVRGAGPAVEEVIVTPRGPIISPLLDGVDHVLSLRAAWLDPHPVRGFLDAPRTRSFEELRRSFAAWPGPGLNVVGADAAGHTGWQLVGQLPRRRRGHGLLPLPGWDAANGWQNELLPFDAMPFELDAPAGFVVSANDAPRAAAANGEFLGADWIDGYRAARITERLAERHDWSVATCLELQTDVASMPWRELRETILALPAERARAARALHQLRAWDGRVTADSPAAAVFELFLSEMACRVARVAAPRGWSFALGAGFGAVLPRTLLVAQWTSRLVDRLREQPGGPFRHGWPAEMTDALAAGVERLEREHGTDPDRWAWGALRRLTLVHPLGARAPLDRVLNIGPVPVGGDANTVAQAGVNPLSPLANPDAIANHRTVIDLGDPERSRYVLAGGQSGQPLSPHYADLFELWRRGEAVPIPWSREAVAAATVATLRLVPYEEGPHVRPRPTPLPTTGNKPVSRR